MNEENNMYKELGLSFTQHRIDKGLTSSQVAAKCGLTLDTIHHIEEGMLDKIKLEYLISACKAVGCNLDICFKNKDDGDETGKDKGS